MTEQARRGLLRLPDIPDIRPQGCKLVAAKTGPHAQHGVYTRHRACANGTNQVTAGECHACAARLAGKEAFAPCRNRGEQRSEPTPFKVMQEQVGHDQVPMGRLVAGCLAFDRPGQPIEDIGDVGRDRPSQGREAAQGFGRKQRLRIKQRQFDLRPARCERTRHAQHQAAVASAELKYAPWRHFLPRRCHVLQGAHHNGTCPHGSVDAPQVAARAQRGRIVTGQAVEHFGGDDAVHHRLTRNKAPWQLNPAPNEDSHHQPSATSSARAACSTK